MSKEDHNKIAKIENLIWEISQILHPNSLIEKEKIRISVKNISIGFQALVMGLWLDLLEDPETFSHDRSKKICFDYIKSHFPREFKGLL